MNVLPTQPSRWWRRAATVVALVGTIAGATTSCEPPPPGASTFLPAGTQCAPATLNTSSGIGLGLPDPKRILVPGAERDTYYAAIKCFREMTHRSVVLRTILPIDVQKLPDTARAFGSLDAFITLAKEQGSSVTPIITLRGGMTGGKEQCPRVGEGASVREVSTVPLAQCEVPTAAMYRTLLQGIDAEVKAKLPGVRVWFGAWNEPNGEAWSLMKLFPKTGSTEKALAKAGEFWRIANDVSGGSALAGDLVVASDASEQTLRTNLRSYYQGSGSPVPAGRWALHPYVDVMRPADLGADKSINDPDSKTNIFFGDEDLTWLTEVGPVLKRSTGTTSLNGNPAGQYRAGQQMRARLGSTLRSTRVALYELTAASTAWDSAIADQHGRARPFFCGLAGIDIAKCVGSPVAFGEPTTTPAPTPVKPTVPLYRYFNQAVGDHYYTIGRDDAALAALGWAYQGCEGRVYLNQEAGTTPLRRWWNEAFTDHFYSVEDSGYAYYGYEEEPYSTGFVHHYNAPASGTVGLHRYWNPTIHDHFYTVTRDDATLAFFGYAYERIEAYVLPSPAGGCP